MQVPLGGWAGRAPLPPCHLPALFLLVIGILPFWDLLRKNHRVRSALVGVNAAVVGLLMAAFYDPVWSGAILAPADFVLTLVAFGLLMLWKVPSWAVVGVTGPGGMLLPLLGIA